MGEAAVALRNGFRSGTRLGRFSLGPLLARGGMGELYLARVEGAERFTKLFAVKVLLPQLSDDAQFVQMFLHEARITARLDHPNIAAVTELGEAGSDYFIAIEYVHGADLRKVLREAKLPLDCALHAASSVCAGLHYAHTFVDPSGEPLHVVHRDVTPSNIVVRYDGEIKIIDFGIAKASTGTKLTHTGTLKGKPSYMSPEQCLEGEVDARSDIWGIGVLLYESTTGQRLFVGDNDFAVMGRVIKGEFPPPSTIVPDYDPALEAIVMRALATDPRDRFESAEALRSELTDFALSRGLALSSAGLGEHMRRLFGSPHVPRVELAPIARPTPRRGQRLLIGGLVAGAFALGALGFRGGSEPADDSPATASELPSDLAPTKQPAAVPEPGAAPLDPPPPAVEAKKAEPAVGELMPPTNERTSPRRRRAKRKPGRNTAGAAKPRAPDPDALMPVGRLDD